ncbi:thioesterase family protein isoform 2 [Zea mays]|uniref:Thioesterase family protein n=1 Tax=Zea mays TaxID=4577 RepID=B6UFY3_MAIZE|nr:thioesterase family protein isoform 2 [Zea mays]ACG48266.1 thioesterase family protein [Zea mays]ONM53394.1 Thioesterase family protein [Zea mays]|eukprot:NP_001152568.1 thioesterase family protein isoform 2 [Zea mays]
MPPPPPVNPQRLSPAESRERTLYFFHGLGVDVPLPVSAERPDAYTSLVRAIVSSAAVTSSRVSCTLTVSPAVANQYNTLHGGAVAAVAEAVGMACARAAAGDKEMFLGELSTAYLAAARLNSEVDVEAQILRKGRSVVVTTIDFRLKDTKKLCYTSRATFYIMPVASL